MSARRAALIARSACLLAVALIACAVVLAVLNGADAYALSFPPALVVGALVGAVVASRRPANPVGWFFLGSAACLALADVAKGYATYGLFTAPGSLPGARAMAWPVSWLWVPGVMLLLCFVPLYFPDGRLVSRRWRWVVRFAVLFSAGHAAVAALSPGEIQNEGLVNPLGIEALRPFSDLLAALVLMPYFALLFASAASLVVRFRRAGSVERQQIKWLALAALAIPVWFVTNAPVQAAAPNLFVVLDAFVVSALIPLAAGVAILRHRLYAIDLIINRALVYGSLTASLVLVYLGGVAATQALFRVLTGQEQQPQLAVVISTLAIAALFSPVRRRIQSFIDRRFYRRKYDAAKTLEAFGSRLREGTDLETLSGDLVSVASRTMQPAHVSLWLRPDDEPEARNATLRQFGHAE